jgi:hypothetical protein
MVKLNIHVLYSIIITHSHGGSSNFRLSASGYKTAGPAVIINWGDSHRLGLNGVRVHAMRAYRVSRGTDPFIFYLHITWSSALNFLSRSVFSREITMVPI